MSSRRAVPVVVLGVVLALAACGQRGGGTASPSPTPDLPVSGDALVLRVAVGGGYGPPGSDLGRLPLVSVHRDGRVITEGPMPAIFPAPAWPNVQVVQVDEATVADLAQAAVDAGVTSSPDLGAPGIADATTTVFTLATGERTTTLEVYALREGEGDPALTAEQARARTALADLVDRATAVGANSGEPQDLAAYEPTAVAALAGPYTPPADDQLTREPVVWSGPALPGESAAPGLGCAVATGEQATAVTAAARAADGLTLWTDGGTTWAVGFRPLLPDETGCADLSG